MYGEGERGTGVREEVLSQRTGNEHKHNHLKMDGEETVLLC